LVFKGVTYMDNFENMLADAREIIAEAVKKCFEDNILNSQMIEKQVNELIERFIVKKVMIRPIIISKVLEL